MLKALKAHQKRQDDIATALATGTPIDRSGEHWQGFSELADDVDQVVASAEQLGEWLGRVIWPRSSE